jgi:hypothetical protein
MSLVTVAASSLPNIAQAQEGSAGAMLEEIVTVARKKSAADAIEGSLVDEVLAAKLVVYSYGWQDGEYDSVNPDVAVFLGPELPRLAPTNYSLGFSWDIYLGTGLINLMASHSYREGHPYDDANNQRFEDQRCTNASINWFSGNDAWNVALCGKNLEDEANRGNLTSIAGLWIAGPMKKGREYGLEINYRF